MTENSLHTLVDIQPTLTNPQAYMEALTPSYGTDTLENFFKDGVTKGMAGQELGDQSFGL